MSASQGTALPPREQLLALRDAAVRSSKNAAASSDNAWSAALSVVDALAADLTHERAEHAALKRKYEEENESWRKFKTWWASKLEGRRSRILASSAGAKTPSGSGKPRSPRRDALDADEQALLLKVGLDPGQLVLDTSSGSRTAAKRPGDEDKSASSPAMKRARASDGGAASSGKSRSRASSGQGSPLSRSGSGRRSLGNVTNTSLGENAEAAAVVRAASMEVSDDEGDISGIKVGGKAAAEKMPPPAAKKSAGAPSDVPAQLAPLAAPANDKTLPSRAPAGAAPAEQSSKDAPAKAAARPATPAKQQSFGSDSSQEPPLFFHSSKRPPRPAVRKPAADGLSTPAPARPAAKALTAQASRATPAAKATAEAVSKPALASVAAAPPVTPAMGTSKNAAASSSTMRADGAQKATKEPVASDASRRTRIVPPQTVQPSAAARAAAPTAPRSNPPPAPVWIREGDRNPRPEGSKSRAPLDSGVSDFGLSDDEQPNAAKDGPSKSGGAAMELFDAEDAEERKRLRREKRRAEAAELAKNPNKFRGNGRYAREIEGDTSKTINSEYQVDPERNGGAAFPHKEVVRNKAERQRMHAFDCACCSDWYEAVGPGAPDAERDAARQAHLQQTSRHRAYGPPSSTPPAYWRVDFPATPDAEDINRKAQEEHERKRRQMETDPRYKRRLQ